MNVDDLKQILELVREHDLAEFEYEQDGLKLRVRKAGAAAPVVAPAVAVAPAPLPVTAAASAGVAASPPTPVPGGDTEEFAIVTSPIVGTFYRAPSPEASSFVEVGGSVRKGQVLCIIEAMKLMNEIESEYEGEVVKVYVENGQPVQYGERLFAIKTK
ncbi:MAG: acetyl-CoA carboxylase biotin carboxyl carrier protein [Vicinamibacteraceae bacterium]|nr:acetyl-CoA carboxylase biotin carboxyl carrier protein [Vicinamibacteraceae bacterium]